ncbi:MAG: hypothetical protein QM660_01090 [Dysgonomonas sp.]
MDIQQYYKLVRNELPLSEKEVSLLIKIIDEFPFFQSAIFMYLRALYYSNSNQYKSELARLSISVVDRRALFYYIFSEEYKRFFDQTGKTDITDDKTNVLLNAFFGNEISEDDSLEIEYTLTNSSLASTDYLTYLEIESKGKALEGIPITEEKANRLKYQSIIDSFIEKSQEDGGIRIHLEKTDDSFVEEQTLNNDEGEDELNEDVFFTETLSKIYIKQGKYEKAYKIIKHLSLNYPKKNIYFADQLSFLEKLIINSKFKDKK